LGKPETELGAAITLRNFLQEGQGYEKFFQQIFELAVGYSQKRIVVDLNNPTPFDKAIIKLFTQSFLLTRRLVKEQCQKEGRTFEPNSSMHQKFI